MNNLNKRKDTRKDDNKPKCIKKECSYGEKCYRRNPAHFREFCHRHLEAILDEYEGTGPYPIPSKYDMDSLTITDQLDVIIEKEFYTPWIKDTPKPVHDVKQPMSDGLYVNIDADSSSNTSTNQLPQKLDKHRRPPKPQEIKQTTSRNLEVPRNTPKPSEVRQNSPKHVESLRGSPKHVDSLRNSPKHVESSRNSPKIHDSAKNSSKLVDSSTNSPKLHDSSRNSPKLHDSSKNSPKLVDSSSKMSLAEYYKHMSNPIQKPLPDRSDYRPIVPPKRRVEDFLNVVLPKGRMASKHAASAPYHIFYTTITAARETHYQPYSITFQEILDRSLGELKCSLQINFMVEIGWLLAQYYFAGYSEKKLTIMYGEECSDLKNISQKKPQVDAHLVHMGTPFGKHHTKMMLLCYEDGSLRVVISTANLYIDDWENRTQGLWFSPSCPELPPTAMPHDGESPTMFKRTLLRYLGHYHSPALCHYVERVKRCDFSHINVFLVASVPGSHFDTDWGMSRVGTLLRQHCAVPANENRRWPLLAQASSIGSYGAQANLWLTGDFLHHFTKIKEQPQTLSTPPEVKLIYPSLENVQHSHDGLLGGGCLPYAASAHTKQPWLNDYLYQWRARSTKRDRAMPHIKCYTRVSPGERHAAYYLLTSGNVSKAAWGSINKGNAALRIMSYEAGVLFLPRFVINEDLFPLEVNAKNRLILPYDVPPTKYTKEMSPWVSDYLCN